MLDKPPPFPSWQDLVSSLLQRSPVFPVALACMSKVVRLGLKTAEFVLGWVVLLILLAFCAGAIPVLCLALFWL